MLEQDLVMGLDCSTTACKAVIWSRDGKLVASGRASLPIQKPQPAWHEQPADAWWTCSIQAIQEAVAQIDSRRLAALCIAPQRETFVILDANGTPRCNALLWMDERCRLLLPEIERGYGSARIHRESGKHLSANLTLGKLFWLSRYEPELCTQGNLVSDVHAYLALRLAGQFATSWGCADPTGLFDMQHTRWNEDLIQACGFQTRQFPDALPPGTIIETILPEAARLCGLPQGIPLVAGIGDGQAAGLGVNVTRPGQAYLNLGTAVVSGTISSQYVFDNAFRTMYSGIPGSYILETVLLGGTYTIGWFLEKFFNQAGLTVPSEEVLEKEARQIAPGADGLILVPYWNSAMNPYWDASASGIIAGWRGIHGQAHLYRAILEGIAYEQRLHTLGVESALGQHIEKYIVVGGGAKSRLWRQIIADVTQKAVWQADAPEATALGAGMLAAAGTGLYPDIQTAASAMSEVSPEIILPDPERSQFYEKLFEKVYRHLYPALQSYLTHLADLTQTQT